MFSKTGCPYCDKAKEALSKVKVGANEVKADFIELDTVSHGDHITRELHEKVKQKTVPQIFVNGQSLGGFDKL